MIEHITVRNFKSIGELSVELSPVTVLIGRSGVGKSNFLRAIRFLRNFLLQGEAAVQLEGGWERIWPFGAMAPLSYLVRFTIPDNPQSFTYELSWGPPPRSVFPPNPPIHVSAERLSFGNDLIFDRNQTSWTKWPGEGAAPPLQPRVYLNSFPTLSEAVLAYTACTTTIGWHDFPASVFAEKLPAGTARFSGLNDNASNYLEVLREITQDLRDQKSRRQILARAKQINPTVDSLELDSIVQPTRVIVGHKVGQRRIGLDLGQESDGFRRYYAHLLALYQTPPKQVLMFEEPENGIYPGALRNLAEEFSAAPGSARGQILLTTQSPELLDGFRPEQIRVVELDERQQTRITPLASEQMDAVREDLLETGELLTVDQARGTPITS